MALFITFEGIDGAGKTTLARGLHRRLAEEGVDAVLTEEPTRTWVGEAVRRGIAEEADPRALALLFLADRALHTEAIAAWLEAGRTVLCDRYHDSTLAYQGTSLEGRMEDPRGWLDRVAAPFVREPDLTFLLRVDPEVGLERLAAVRDPTPFERAGFLRKVQAAYEALATAPRFVVLDAARPPEDLVEQAAKALAARLHR